MVRFLVNGTTALDLTDPTFILNTNEIFLQCQTSLGAVNITLPPIITSGKTWGFRIFINDVDNNASVNNITITADSSDRINGLLSSPIILNQNGATGFFEISGRANWMFLSSSLEASGSQILQIADITSTVINALPASANPTILLSGVVPANRMISACYGNYLTAFINAGADLARIDNSSNPTAFFVSDSFLFTSAPVIAVGTQVKVSNQQYHINTIFKYTTVQDFTLTLSFVGGVVNPRDFTAGRFKVYLELVNFPALM